MAGKIHSGGTVHFSITRRPPRGTPRRRENSHRAASATFALKVGVWFRRGRLFMVSPDSLGTACPLSGRNSTYRLVQISETSSLAGILLSTAFSSRAISQSCDSVLRDSAHSCIDLRKCEEGCEWRANCTSLRRSGHRK